MTQQLKSDDRQTGPVKEGHSIDEDGMPVVVRQDGQSPDRPGLRGWQLEPAARVASPSPRHG
ncbi:MAG: hypothetical protein EOP38_24660 [Rubrivivax sp.]|nr:MAG: hypothetical protein EOP38_24660 [Rubrivivax sp.]